MKNLLRKQAIGGMVSRPFNLKLIVDLTSTSTYSPDGVSVITFKGVSNLKPGEKIKFRMLSEVLAVSAN